MASGESATRTTKVRCIERAHNQSLGPAEGHQGRLSRLATRLGRSAGARVPLQLLQGAVELALTPAEFISDSFRQRLFWPKPSIVPGRSRRDRG